jgi:hypothetical protein
MKIASMIRAKADSIAAQNILAKVVVIGDFNSTPDDQEMKILTRSGQSGITLCNLADSLAETGGGTYRYQGTWEMIDQVIVSERLLSSGQGLIANHNMMTIFNPGFLLGKDPKYPGFIPLSTYRGYKYQGGFSDHLPVLLELKVGYNHQPE